MSKFNSKSARGVILSRRITHYETQDGKLHATLTDARKHQIKLNIRACIEHNEHLQVCDVDLGEVIELLCDNASELSTLLRQFMQLSQVQVSKPSPAEPAA